MSEFNPMDELGLTHDKQLICSCEGFLQANNSTRDLCDRFISNGGKFYDIVSRYDDMVANVLNRSEGRFGNTTRFVAPFLKAFGVTDYSMHEHAGKIFREMPGAKKVIGHLMNMLPTFVSTSSYEHNMMNICDSLDIPRGVVDCSEINMDSFDFGRQEAKRIRELVGEITTLRIPTKKYDPNAVNRLEYEDAVMIRTLDKVLKEDMKELSAADLMKNVKSVGANEKAYFFLDIRKRTMIDFDGTAFVGGDTTDMQVMNLIKEGSGLAMSFNGTESAVKGCNIAVMSQDCTVAAVLVQEFYNEGIEAVFSLVENWNRESLMKGDYSDPYLMKAMLDANPKKLPEVHIVKRQNMKEIARKSDMYRENLFTQYGRPR